MKWNRRDADPEYEEELARVMWRMEQMAPRPPWPSDPVLKTSAFESEDEASRWAQLRAWLAFGALACLAVALLLIVYEVQS